MSDHQWGDHITITGGQNSGPYVDAYNRMMNDTREHAAYSILNPSPRTPLPFIIKWKWRFIEAWGILRGDND